MLEGGEELRAVALRLQAAGQVGLKRAMYKRLRGLAADAPDRIRRSALETLPQRGGLNQWVADATYRIYVLSGPRSAGVGLRMSKKGHDLPPINAGMVRHPVYPDLEKPRKEWAWAKETQRVKPGFFSDAMNGMEPVSYRAAVEIMRETAAQAGFR